ncbi:uncharacterized protein N7459_003669 [Penicillium hispanicum]|uniref:uncharacterized protein n=1 Tax=Penicillium hispanicum TaxID=1080232 RepID=UPI0025416563|nr:uncharacterized protein N7459_003669 [Penicillium hispanicum]KAJ5587904.1 hypothetical protein N7459_003669 [Penicillium hispanicum]
MGYQGNHYCARDYGSGASNSNSYHDSNSCIGLGWPSVCYLVSGDRNGSYYYSNSNGSTYYNNGSDGSTYTPSSGQSSGQK